MSMQKTLNDYGTRGGKDNLGWGEGSKILGGTTNERSEIFEN